MKFFDLPVEAQTAIKKRIPHAFTMFLKSHGNSVDFAFFDMLALAYEVGNARLSHGSVCAWEAAQGPRLMGIDVGSQPSEMSTWKIEKSGRSVWLGPKGPSPRHVSAKEARAKEEALNPKLRLIEQHEAIRDLMTISGLQLKPELVERLLDNRPVAVLAPVETCEPVAKKPVDFLAINKEFSGN